MLCIPFSLFGQHRLQVVVSGVTSSDGDILVALYREASAFPKFEKVFRIGRAPAETGNTKVVLEDLPEGEYALAVFHDESGNDTLDKNWLGFPKEDYGPGDPPGIATILLLLYRFESFRPLPANRSCGLYG